MNLTYTLTFQDFLNFQLFNASESPRVRKKRARNRWSVAFLFLVMAIVYLLINTQYLMSMVCLLLSILWYWLYPLRDASMYRKHYLNHIRDVRADQLGAFATVEITTDQIKMHSNSINTEIATSEVQDVVEIPENMLIRLNGGMAVIIPKGQVNLEETREFLKRFASELQVPYRALLDWKWK